jgi:hypothetical protein
MKVSKYHCCNPRLVTLQVAYNLYCLIVSAYFIESLAAEIRRIGLVFEPYADRFEQNGIDGELLQTLSDAELNQMLEDTLQVADIVHRKRLMIFLHKYLHPTSPASTSQQSKISARGLLVLFLVALLSSLVIYSITERRAVLDTVDVIHNFSVHFYDKGGITDNHNSNDVVSQFNKDFQPDRANRTTSEIVSQYLKNNSLSVLAAMASGVYRDAAKSKRLNLQKLVVVTASNFGFLNFFHNFACYMERLDYKFLTIAMELHTHYYLSRRGYLSYFIDHGANASEGYNVFEKPVLFRTPEYNKITYLKIKAVLEILMLGYDVLFSDTDIAYLRDPIPNLLFKNVDLITSFNKICLDEHVYTPESDFVHDGKADGNTGFYFVRSTNATVTFWSRVFERTSLPEYKGIDDQTIFWHEMQALDTNKLLYAFSIWQGCRDISDEELSAVQIRENRAADAILSICPLNYCQFTAGLLGDIPYKSFAKNILSRNLSNIFTIHANYIVGANEKFQHMVSSGLWIANLGTVTNFEFYTYFNIPKPSRGNETSDNQKRYYDGVCSDAEPFFGISGKLQPRSFVMFLILYLYNR